MIIFTMLLNGIISFWNAKVAGEVWAESKGLGGSIRTLTWCAAIQSVIGFSYIYITILVYVIQTFHVVSSSGLQFMTSLSYLFLIIPLLGTGLIITLHSWIQVSREKSLCSMGIAAWNTFAITYNTYHAIQTIGPAFTMTKEGLTNIFSDSDSDGDDKDDDMLVLALVILALLAGVLTTKIIMNIYTGSLPVPTTVRHQYEQV